jgi:hypothetical protein
VWWRSRRMGGAQGRVVAKLAHGRGPGPCGGEAGAWEGVQGRVVAKLSHGRGPGPCGGEAGAWEGAQGHVVAIHESGGDRRKADMGMDAGKYCFGCCWCLVIVEEVEGSYFVVLG